MGWLETYPHSVFASALLSDGKLIAWRVGYSAREQHDFYKDFYYAQKKESDFPNVTVQTKEFVCEEEGTHNTVFNEAEMWIASTFEPHAEHMGALPKTFQGSTGFFRAGTPYEHFVTSTPDQLAEKLLKASCCYCVFGKGQGMGCRNTQGTDCKTGILAYLTGKTLD